MIFEEAYKAIGRNLAVRNYVAAYETCFAYRKSAPTTRDYGCSLFFEADISTWAGGDPATVVAQLREAEPLLRAYPMDYGRLCLSATCAGSHQADAYETSMWADRYHKLAKKKPCVRPFAPAIMHNEARVLLTACRWRDALKHLGRAYQLAEEVAPERCKEIALMAAWAATEAQHLDSAAEWLTKSEGAVKSTCWCDVRRSVLAMYQVTTGDCVAAADNLRRSTATHIDEGAVFLALGRIKLAVATGDDVRPALSEALGLASDACQQWLVEPVRAAARGLGEGGDIREAALA